jgi:hypothetical protein
MRLEEDFRFNLQGQLSFEKTEIDVAIASKIAKEFAVSFYLFLAENYHTEKETWTNDLLPLGEVQNKKTYEIYKIENVLKIYENGL